MLIDSRTVVVLHFYKVLDCSIPEESSLVMSNICINYSKHSITPAHIYSRHKYCNDFLLLYTLSHKKCTNLLRDSLSSSATQQFQIKAILVATRNNYKQSNCNSQQLDPGPHTYRTQLATIIWKKYARIAAKCPFLQQLIPTIATGRPLG